MNKPSFTVEPDEISSYYNHKHGTEYLRVVPTVQKGYTEDAKKAGWKKVEFTGKGQAILTANVSLKTKSPKS